VKERFVHVGFMFPGVPKMRDLEPSFYKIGDWVRYSQTSWIVWTSLETQEMLRILVAALDKSDNLLITSLTGTDFMGVLPMWVWDWIRSKGPNIVTDAEQDAFFKALSGSKA